MDGVAAWFERRGEIPLTPPPGLREYEPLGEEADRAEPAFADSGICGLAFGLDYMDTRGWVSTRTIRCMAFDPLPPASIKAWCSLRKSQRIFRLGRIVSIIDLRSGRRLSEEEQVALIAPYLPGPADPEACAMRDLRRATGDGVLALLHLAMPDGRLADSGRRVVLDYVAAEALSTGCPLPAGTAVELWIDNLCPPLDAVIGAVERLLAEKDKLARLLPLLLKMVRSREAFADSEESVRDLITAVRSHYRRKLLNLPSFTRASA